MKRCFIVMFETSGKNCQLEAKHCQLFGSAWLKDVPAHLAATKQSERLRARKKIFQVKPKRVSTYQQQQQWFEQFEKESHSTRTVASKYHLLSSPVHSESARSTFHPMLGTARELQSCSWWILIAALAPPPKTS